MDYFTQGFVCELQKEAKYPVSRFLTHPATATVGLGGVAAAGAAAAGALSAPAAVPLVAGAAGLGYLVNKIKRFIHARALVSRIAGEAHGVSGLMGTERKMLEEIGKAKSLKKASQEEIKKEARIPKRIVKAIYASPEIPYGFSEMLTSRAVGGGLSAAKAVKGMGGLAAVTSAAGAPTAAVVIPAAAAMGAGTKALERIVASRALAGRVAKGGEGLTKMERDVVTALHHHKVVKKRRLAAGALAALVGAGAYTASKKGKLESAT